MAVKRLEFGPVGEFVEDHQGDVDICRAVACLSIRVPAVKAAGNHRSVRDGINRLSEISPRILSKMILISEIILGAITTLREEPGVRSSV